MGHPALHLPQDHDLVGLLYAFAFCPGQPGREIDSAQFLRTLGQPLEPGEFLWVHLNGNCAGAADQIIAGFFGMNVGGVPLAKNPPWVLVALVATFTVLVGRWAFRKRREY